MSNDEELRSEREFAEMIEDKATWTDAKLEELRVAFELDLAGAHREGNHRGIAFARERISMIDAEQMYRNGDDIRPPRGYEH